MQPAVTFLGLGLMGQPMASRIQASGAALTVWNRSSAKTAELAAAGANVQASAQQAAAGADIVFTMLADGLAVSEIVAVILPALRKGVLVIDMSSTQQSEAQRLHTELAMHGIGFLDAPVSGGVVGAQAGTLAIMVGGAKADFARAMPLLSLMGRPTHVGGPGCGQLAKLCNQLIVGGTLAILAEALLLAQAGGADPSAVRQALRGGFAESRILEVHGQRMLERNFLPGGQVKSQAKDMQNILTAASTVGLNLPLSAMVAQSFARLLATVPQADQSAALLDLEQLNPGQRLGSAADQLP